ncbi:MAG: PorT family protein [Bacteroidetes bacterium]|nr:PorT family protein [Bacteroidota bacterium]
MKRIFVVLFVTCSLLTVQAQKSKREEGIKLGIKGGLNASNLMGDVEDQGMRTSIHLGLLAEIIVNDKFSVQPELLYSGQGSTYTGDIPGFSRTKLDYVTLPVLAKFKLVNNLSLEAGPQLGFLVSAKNKTNNSNDKIDGVKTLDFSVGAGLEYELKSGVIFQGRYNLGLTNVGGDLVPDNKRASNSVIQVSVGYLF